VGLSDLRPIDLRDGRPGDEGEIARFHVAVREEAFGAFLPASAAVGTGVEGRTAQWGEVLRHAKFGRDRFLLLAEGHAGIAGFAACGPPMREVAGYDAQLWSIYVAAAERGRGLGGLLFRNCATRLAYAGYRALSLFTPAANATARAFYEGRGGRVVAERSRLVHGREVRSIAYGWPDLEALARRLGR
jgi:ribosomal protein S18 acetylase RimI-like enzyme